VSKVSTVGKTPHVMYLLSSFTYLTAMLTSIYALHYVSFPAQVYLMLKYNAMQQPTLVRLSIAGEAPSCDDHFKVI